MGIAVTEVGTFYLVLTAVTFTATLANVAQALLIRSDPAPRAVAVSCLGFTLYGLGNVMARGTVGGDQRLGGAAIGVGLVLIFGFVPMTAWTLLDLPFTRMRGLIVTGLIAVAGVRLADLLVAGTPAAELTRFEVPTAFAAWGVSVVWTVDSFRAIRTRTPYARTMTAFGLFGFAGTVPGILVVLGLVEGPDLLGTGALPFIGFVNVLSALRYASAVKNAAQPAGDIERYQVLDRLGSGGMGDVFLARRRGPAGFLRDVVLKTLKATAQDPEAHRRFLAEARLAAQLRHPNIVDVYDLGEQPGGFFIVMERIDGPTLGQIITASRERARPVSAEVTAELGVQLCRALGFAHAAGVIHRDLKPQNVMLTFTGIAKLIDFGIAQEQRRSSAEPREPREQGVAGTHGFVAPERMYGGDATPASDLFSLGVVLYLLLTGQYPFPQADAVELIAAVRDRTAPSLAELRPDCPAALRQAVERCLAYEPGGRPRFAASLEAELEEALRGTRVDLAGFVAELFPGRALPAGAAPTSVSPHASTVTAQLRG